MYIVLSQKIDTDSSYSDEVFKIYHYPARYKNQVHSGDIFVYYQGNRYKKEQRYYFGTGIVGEIYSPDEINYYAELTQCGKFEHKVPIYLNASEYIEQKGYESVRNSPNPPWQSSIRPLSVEAYNFIISHAGFIETLIEVADVEQLKAELKKAVKAFYVSGDNGAILTIAQTAKEIASVLQLAVPKDNDILTEVPYSSEKASDKKRALFDYCKNMRMTYSYKPLLIMAVLDSGIVSGKISINEVISYFRNYYNNRRASSLKIEKANCIYHDPSACDDRIAGNIVSNPVKALMSSGYFIFNGQEEYFGFLPEIWGVLSDSDKAALRSLCVGRLEKYFSSI